MTNIIDSMQWKQLKAPAGQHGDIYLCRPGLLSRRIQLAAKEDNPGESKKNKPSY
jgi:hypothetical protein